MREVWMAAVSGGFHFTLRGEPFKQWKNTVTGELLTKMLTDACQEQSSEDISFSF
jgi:frataxin-like iron-binding protein CyaY